MIIHDGTTKAKNKVVFPTSIDGIHVNENVTIDYSGVEFLDLNLGSPADVNVRVPSTNEGLELTLRYGDSSSVIDVASTNGPFNLIKGDGFADIKITKAKGPVSVICGLGVHEIDISGSEKSVGSVDIVTKGGPNEKIIVTDIKGDVNVNLGPASNHDIDIRNTKNGNFKDIGGVVTSWVGDVTITTAGGGAEKINVTNTQGSVNSTVTQATDDTGTDIDILNTVVDVTIDTKDTTDGNFNVIATDGSVTITSGSGPHDINIIDTKVDVTMNCGEGSHTIDLLETGGDVTIVTDGGGAEKINVTNTQGSVNSTVTQATDDTGTDIDILNTVVDVTIDTKDTTDGNFNVIATDGSVTITSGNGPHLININITGVDVTVEADVAGTDIVEITVFDTGGDLEITTGDGFDKIDIDQTVGDQKVTCAGGNDTVYIHSVYSSTTLTINAGEQGRSTENPEDSNYISIEGLIQANLNITGGNGQDIVTINNNTETEEVPKTSTLFKRTLQDEDTEKGCCYQNMTFGAGNDNITIKSTPKGSKTFIWAGDGEDKIEVFGLGVSLLLPILVQILISRPFFSSSLFPHCLAG